MKQKLDVNDQETLTSLVQETENWLYEEKTYEEYENKFNEVQKIVEPIMKKLYSGGEGMGGMDPSSMAGMDPSSMGAPTIDEVD